jgi:hypothetical protein
MSKPVRTTKTTWSSEVKKADKSKEEKPTYEFSNGRKFVKK